MKRVLVVDDNTDILELVQMILDRQGYDTITCNKGEDVLKNITYYDPQVILLDVFLDSTNGVDICNQLKSDL
jgi:DNA-binding response OmpR family regulator